MSGHLPEVTVRYGGGASSNSQVQITCDGNRFLGLERCCRLGHSGALTVTTLPNDFVIVRGVEPSLKWKTFAHEIVDLAENLEVDALAEEGNEVAEYIKNLEESKDTAPD